MRRLLAEARHDEPIPAEVADRLDRVLAGLARDEPGAPGVAPVVDLAARRRRRNAAALLAGAAAVIVAGFGVGQVIDVGSDSDDAATRARQPQTRTRDRREAAGPGREAAPTPPAAAADDRASSAAPQPRPTGQRRSHPPLEAPRSATSSDQLDAADAATTAGSAARARRTRRSPRSAARRRHPANKYGTRRASSPRCYDGAPGRARAAAAAPTAASRPTCSVRHRRPRWPASPSPLDARAARRGNLPRLRSVVDSTDHSRRPSVHVRAPQRHHHRLRPDRLHRSGLRRPGQPAARSSSRAR